MSLDKYDQKRDFQRTPEPTGRQVSQGHLIFVVQKHHASHLHYDFRLQAGEVLASWAIPKGPSMDPTIKRLAMHVEDHPLDYANFQGVIPEGNYGAGTVEIWDYGTYEPEVDPTIGVERGKLDFVLLGGILLGGFALIRLAKAKGDSWLLFKKRDVFALKDWTIAGAE